MLRIISKIYSLLIVTQIVSFEMVDAIHNNPFRRYGLILLTIPVIYHLIQELFFKNKSAENNTLKIYSFVYICFYALWCLFDIIYLIFTMGGISGYMAIMHNSHIARYASHSKYEVNNVEQTPKRIETDVDK